MKMRKRGWIVAMAALLALVGTATLAYAAKPGKAAKKAAAATGKVSKLDTTAKTFVVTNRKKGDTTVSYGDQTAFKKAATEAGATPADATIADLKDGERVTVRGKMENGKVQATQIMIGARKRKAKNSNQ